MVEDESPVVGLLMLRCVESQQSGEISLLVLGECVKLLLLLFINYGCWILLSLSLGTKVLCQRFVGLRRVKSCQCPSFYFITRTHIVKVEYVLIAINSLSFVLLTLTSFPPPSPMNAKKWKCDNNSSAAACKQTLLPEEKHTYTPLCLTPDLYNKN